MAEAKIIKTNQTISQNLQKHLIKHLLGKNWIVLDMKRLTLAMQMETVLVPLPLPTNILYLHKNCSGCS